MTLVTCLADGADQLSAEAALDAGWTVQVILPFAFNRYKLGYPTQEWVERAEIIMSHPNCKSVFTFDGNDSDLIQLSYEVSGKAMLQGSDLMIAFWNGEEAKGPGGTAKVVENAVRNDVPVVWISPDGGATKILLKGNNTRNRAEALECGGEAMLKLLSDTFLPAAGIRNDLKQYLRTTKPVFDLSCIWQSFLEAFSGGQVFHGEFGVNWLHHDDYIVSRSIEWSQEMSSAALPKTVAVSVDSDVKPYYEWADAIAADRTALYRASYLINYTLGVMAITLAAVGWALGGESELWSIGEISCIGVILLNTECARRMSWLRRSLQCRLLAEWLRQFRFHLPIFASGVKASTQPHLPKEVDPDNSWMNWYFKTVQRSASIPTISLNRASLEALKKWICEAHLQRQSRYHHDVYRVAETANASLHIVSVSLFVVSFVCALTHVWNHWVWLSVCTIVFPAAATGFAAIRAHSAFEIVAKRSQAMASHLQILETSMGLRPARNERLDSLGVRELLFESTRVMNEETIAWNTVFEDREVELP